MLAPRNATQVGFAPPNVSSANDAVADTAVSATLLHAGNSSRVMDNLNTAASAVPTTSNADIPPPVLSSSNTFSTSVRDFTNQTDLEYQWSSLKKQLTTQTLSEQEALAVLSSGILQTETGKAIAGLFADAMLRSVRPLGATDNDRLKMIIDVVCHLPPNKWQAALGESVRFPSGQSAEGVTGYIQSQLDRSSELRDERIANNELLSDVHRETLKKLTEQGRRYIRSSDGELDGALMMLEDASDLRPSPKDVHAQLEEFVRHLEKGDVKRIRWTERYEIEVKALRDQVKPVDNVEPTWLEWLVGPSWLEGVFERPASPSASMNSTHTAAKPPSPNDGSGWLLKGLQSFERSADFYSGVTANGPRVPDSFVGKLLYVCNALDTFHALRLESSHISTSRPARTPNSHDGNNGASSFPMAPLNSAPQMPEVTSPTDAFWTGMSQLAAQMDNVVSRMTRNMMPWDSAFASDLEEVKVLCDEVYRPTTAPFSEQASFIPQIEVVREQLQSWLSRMSASLVNSGVAVLSGAGNLIEQNPGRAVGALTAYMAISNFYAHWFLPEPAEMIDPLQGLGTYPYEADEEFVTHENTMEGIAELYEEHPDFAQAVIQSISRSDYLYPGDDPQVIEDVEELLQQPVPGYKNVTYQDYLQEVRQLAVLDVREEFLDDSSTAESAVIASVASVTAGVKAAGRDKRSLREDTGMFAFMQTSESGVSAHASAHWLIEAAQRKEEAHIDLQPGEEIAPGVTIEQCADEFIKANEELQLIFDPASFIKTIIGEAIANSNLPADIKLTLNSKTRFTVEYISHRSSSSADKNVGRVKRFVGYSHPQYSYKEFDLAQLFAGQHKKAATHGDEITVQWPRSYTAEFKTQVEENNFEALYEALSQEILSQPSISELWKLGKQKELERTVKIYLQGEAGSTEGKKIARDFLDGNVKPRTIAIRDGAFSKPDKVGNAVYLRGGKADEGLFVFLGREGTVIEDPPELRKRTKSIEQFPELAEQLSKRISLKEFLARDEYDFKYSLGYVDPRITKLSTVDWLISLVLPYKLVPEVNGKLPYEPILFGWEDNPHEPIFDELFQRQFDQVKIAIDTLTSTPDERMTDTILQYAADVLSMLATFTMLLPGAGAIAAGLSMLLGLGASAADFARGEFEDDPQIAAQHKANALHGAIFELAGPFVGKQLGKAFSAAINSRIAAMVVERLKMSGRLPVDIVKYLPKYKGKAEAVIRQIRKIPKWMPPLVKAEHMVAQKLRSKFKNYRVVNKLKRLDKGPQVAQRLMDKTGAILFKGPTEGYVYKGFVMRGDMRPPQEIFENGFKLRTPITNVRQVNGMNGAFGAGKDALDPDGMGISTSAFYKESGAGAYQYGGGRGGYTYLIDGRDLTGYDLYKNHNFASEKSLKQGFKPLEINYGVNIDGSKVLGAYDSKGVFIPNPSAVQNSVAASMPDPAKVDVNMRRWKHPFMNKNFTSTLNNSI